MCRRSLSSHDDSSCREREQYRFKYLCESQRQQSYMPPYNAKGGARSTNEIGAETTLRASVVVRWRGQTRSQKGRQRSPMLTAMGSPAWQAALKSKNDGKMSPRSHTTTASLLLVDCEDLKRGVNGYRPPRSSSENVHITGREHRL
jgi:hypothetical protein